MMRSKADITSTLAKFVSVTPYDEELQKHYLAFDDRKRGGIYTLMPKEGRWSIHGYGLNYCDDSETFLTEKELVDFLWNHRAVFRKSAVMYSA